MTTPLSGNQPETPAEWVARTRIEQGLSAAVDDTTTIARVHYLLVAASRARRGGDVDAA